MQFKTQNWMVLFPATGHIFRSFLSLVVQNLPNFGALTQQGFRVISKTTFDNL